MVTSFELTVLTPVNEKQKGKDESQSFLLIKDNGPNAPSKEAQSCLRDRVSPEWKHQELRGSPRVLWED